MRDGVKLGAHVELLCHGVLLVCEGESRNSSPRRLPIDRISVVGRQVGILIEGQRVVLHKVEK